MPSNLGRWTLCAALLTVSAAASATPFDTLETVASDYNVFLLGNLGSASAGFGSDTQGAVAVVGNAYLNNASIDSSHTGAAALQVGGNLTSTGGSELGNSFIGGNASFTTPSVYGALVVNGNLTAQGGGAVTGNVFVGGSGNFSGGATVSGSVTDKGASLTFGAASTPNGFYVSPTTSVNVPSYMSGSVHTSGGPTTPAPPLDLYGTATDLANASTGLAALNATHVNSTGGVVTINLTQNGMNVVDLSMVDGSTITGINLVTANGVTPTGLILNVDGNNLSFNGGSFSLGSLGANDVLFNFTDATNISLSSVAFEGSLLAPLATVNFTSGNLTGALIADNYVGNGELHEDAFTAILPPEITVADAAEPGSVILFMTGLFGIGFVLRRKGAA